MKKTLLAVFATFLFRTALGQIFLIDFETAHPLISIDSTSQNIWQIGSPDKNLFDSSCDGVKVIVTDTINYYPPNNKSSFLLKLPFITNGSEGIQLDFCYKLNSDTLKDGGSIEYSIDGGLNWINLHYDSFNWGSDSYLVDTLFDGTYGISGNKAASWHFFSISTCSVSYPDSIQLRFSFRSDSTDNEKEGWLIDNIMAGVIICEGIEEINTNYHFSSVFPNPVINTSFLQIKNQNSLIRQVDFYDALGRKISSLHHPYQSNIPIGREKFGEGIFFYSIELSNHKSDSGSFVVQ